MDKNYVDRKTERRDKYHKKRKGKVTKENKNFKNIKLEELKRLEADEELYDGSISTVYTQK